MVYFNSSKSNLSYISPEVGFGRGLVVLIFSDESGAKIFISRRKEDVTGHPLTTVAISAGETIKYSIDLKDGSWEIPRVLGGDGVKNLTLEYNVPMGTLDRFMGTKLIPVKSEVVFEGCIKTEVVILPKSLRDMLKIRE